MKVTGFTALLSGSGDSGSLDDIIFEGDGKLENAWEPLRDIRIIGSCQDVCERIVDECESDATREGNWYDNEGGEVEANYVVVNGRIECDYISISYNEPDYDDEEDEFEDDEVGMEP